MKRILILAVAVFTLSAGHVAADGNHNTPTTTTTTTSSTTTSITVEVGPPPIPTTIAATTTTVASGDPTCDHPNNQPNVCVSTTAFTGTPATPALPPGDPTCDHPNDQPDVCVTTTTTTTVDPPPVLPVTGANTSNALIVAAVLLLAFGVAAVFAARRRTPS